MPTEPEPEPEAVTEPEQEPEAVTEPEPEALPALIPQPEPEVLPAVAPQPEPAFLPTVAPPQAQSAAVAAPAQQNLPPRTQRLTDATREADEPRTADNVELPAVVPFDRSTKANESVAAPASPESDPSGMVVGISIGLIICILIAVAVFLFIGKRKKQQREFANTQVLFAPDYVMAGVKKSDAGMPMSPELSSAGSSMRSVTPPIEAPIARIPSITVTDTSVLESAADAGLGDGGDRPLSCASLRPMSYASARPMSYANTRADDVSIVVIDDTVDGDLSV